MANTIKADNDTWSPRLGDSAREGFRTIVFFCASNGQRPYRVVEVPEGRFASQEDLDRLSSGDLRDLFAETTSMGVPRTHD